MIKRQDLAKHYKVSRTKFYTMILDRKNLRSISGSGLLTPIDVAMIAEEFGDPVIPIENLAAWKENLRVWREKHALQENDKAKAKVEELQKEIAQLKARLETLDKYAYSLHCRNKELEKGEITPPPSKKRQP